MMISIDTNVFAVLWNNHDSSNLAAASTLGKLRLQNRLMVSAPVYAELLAGPLRTEAALDQFFAETEIEVDWMLEENVWREAGKAYREYVKRRKKSSGGASRRILADFLIGAHALVGGHSLLTIDKSHYATAFPKLKVISI